MGIDEVTIFDRLSWYLGIDRRRTCLLRSPIDLDHALDQCQQHPAFRFLDLPERGDRPKAVLQAAEYLDL